MHFIITALGTYGDVHPMLALGEALAGRGHDVLVVANPYFTREVERAGLPLAPLGTREEYLQLTAHPHIWHPLRGLRVVVQSVLQHLRPLLQLIDHHRRGGQTVLAAHGLDLASRLARESWGLKTAAVTFAPMALWSARRPPRLSPRTMHPALPAWVNALQFSLAERALLRPLVGPPLNAVRRELGLPPVGRLLPHWWYDVDLTLCLFPEWYAQRAPGWPANTAFAGFPLWDGGATHALSEGCQRFLDAGEPPIVFAPGSGNRHAARFFAQAAQACLRLPRRGVLLTRFPEQIPPSLPPGVGHFDFEPLSKLLPRAAAFVHHGGIGSTAQGLAAGVPQLIRPMAYDQHDNAQRLRQLGVAHEIAPHRFTARRAAHTLELLLASGEVRQACQKAAALCDGLTARQTAARLLEGMLDETAVGSRR